LLRSLETLSFNMKV